MSGRAPHRRLRTALAVVALLLSAWFAVLARDAAVGNAAADRLHERPGMSSAEWADSIDDMRQAAFLNPGSEWTVDRAAYLILRDRRAAWRLAEDVVRREPDHLEAWVVIYNAARGVDARRAAHAAVQMRRLSPPVGRGD
jgi:hypothetical protein